MRNTNVRNTSMNTQYHRGGAPRQNSQWVYFGTKKPYNGHVIKIGEDWFTTEGGGIEAGRKQVVKRK